MASSPHLTRFLLVPLQPAALLTTAVLSAVLEASLWAGVFGIPLILILSGWTFKYSFAFLDRLVAGDREAPVLSVEMIVGSFGEARSLLPLIVVVFALFASGAGAFFAGPAFAALAATALLACLPAVLAVQGWTGRLAHSLSVRTCATMVRVLGRDYGWIVGCTLAITLVCVIVPQLAGGVPSMIRIALLLYTWLALVAITGRAVHCKRTILQQEIPLVVAELRDRSPEEIERVRELWLDSIYAAWRSGAEDNAWRLVSDGIDATQEPLEEFRWLYARLARWEPSRFSSRVAQELLAHLLSANRDGEALRLVKERLAIDPGFHPEGAIRVPRT